jgi:cysteine desulfurase/selenocysteine lyase
MDIEKGITYLNHAASGPFSRRMLDVMNEFLRAGSEDNIDDYPGLVKIIEETKEIIAEYLNTDSSRIAFTDNTTNGMNIIAQGLRWKKGDKIILNDIEFPANVYPFLNLKTKGVEIEFVKSHDGIVSAEDIIDRITPETRLVSVSMVQFLTGYRIDLQKLSKICRERNVYLSVDAIQGLGALNLDIQESQIDFLSCGTQKWLLGMQGLAFIYISEKLQQEIQPAYVGWLGVNDAWNMTDYNLSLKESAERFQPGTLNSAGIYSLNASLKLFQEFGFGNVEKNVISNSEYLIRELQKLNISPFLSELKKQFLSGIISFKHPHAYSILEVLKEKNIVIAVREGIVRISPHFYNNKDDIDKLIDTLKIIIK